MGLPSIVTDINGSREIIINGENGTIIPPQDEESLYNVMKFWVENREIVANMATKSRKLIADRFEKTFVQKCLLDFYKELDKNVQ